MWFNSQDQPESIEAIIALQICTDPVQVYLDAHPGVNNEWEEVQEIYQAPVWIEREDEEPIDFVIFAIYLFPAVVLALVLFLIVTHCIRRKRKQAKIAIEET